MPEGPEDIESAIAPLLGHVKIEVTLHEAILIYLWESWNVAIFGPRGRESVVDEATVLCARGANNANYIHQALLWFTRPPTLEEK